MDVSKLIVGLVCGSDIFKPDPQLLENKERYEEIKQRILGDESEEEDWSDAG